MSSQVIWLPGILFFLASIFSPIKLLASTYYENKVIKIIVGHEPGGGYDRMARLLAKHLPKHIAGKPSVIVENMPGAQAVIASKYIYNIAKPDGLTVGTFDRSLPFAQLLKAEGVKFDMTKYSWIGSAAVGATVLILRADHPCKTIEDLWKAKGPIYMAAVGPWGADSQVPNLLREFVGRNLKVVNYPSGAAGMLAIERKEVDGMAGSYSSYQPFIERGLVRPFIRGRESEPGIENLPVDEDLTNNKIGKTLMAMRSAPDRISRPFVAPPGTPADIINILRDAFVKGSKDQELKEESKKLMMSVEYVPPDECLKVVNYVLNQPEDVIKEFRKYIQF